MNTQHKAPGFESPAPLHSAENCRQGLALAEQYRELAEQTRELGQTVKMQRAQIEQLEAQNRALQESFDMISNSTFWKITKPLRFALDKAKAFLRPKRITALPQPKEVQEEPLEVHYHIDDFCVRGNKLHISGWIFDRENEIEKLELMLCRNGTEEIREITKRRLVRQDVKTAFLMKLALRSGFDQFFRIKIPRADTILAYLRFTVKGQRKSILIHELHFIESPSAALLKQNGCVRDQFLSTEYRCAPLPESVDIIVPVYNGVS